MLGQSRGGALKPPPIGIGHCLPAWIWCAAALWSLYGCVIVRTTQNLSLDAANRGSWSLIKRPGVLQAIALKGPRILLGASGLRSNVSSWLGPPKSIRKITDLARAVCDLT